MKIKVLNLIIFICALIVLCTSLKIFYNIGIFVDEYGITPSEVYGSDFMLMTAWLRLALIAVITLISGIGLFVKR